MSLALFPPERRNTDVAARSCSAASSRSRMETARGPDRADASPASRARKYLPHRVGLPDAVVLGGNEHLVEVARNLPQR